MKQINTNINTLNWLLLTLSMCLRCEIVLEQIEDRDTQKQKHNEQSIDRAFE